MQLDLTVVNDKHERLARCGDFSSVGDPSNAGGVMAGIPSDDIGTGATVCQLPGGSSQNTSTSSWTSTTDPKDADALARNAPPKEVSDSDVSVPPC